MADGDQDKHDKGGGEKATREARLAAKLRENLRRRKAQARQMDGGDQDPLPKTDSES